MVTLEATTLAAISKTVRWNDTSFKARATGLGKVNNHLVSLSIMQMELMS